MEPFFEKLSHLFQYFNSLDCTSLSRCNMRLPFSTFHLLGPSLRSSESYPYLYLDSSEYFYVKGRPFLASDSLESFSERVKVISFPIFQLTWISRQATYPPSPIISTSRGPSGATWDIYFVYLVYFVYLFRVSQPLGVFVRETEGHRSPHLNS